MATITAFRVSFDIFSDENAINADALNKSLVVFASDHRLAKDATVSMGRAVGMVYRPYAARQLSGKEILAAF